MPLKLISREPCGLTTCGRILYAASSAHNGSVQRQDPGSLEKLEDRQKVSLRRVALGRIMASHVNLHDPGSMPCQGEMGGHCSWHIDEQRPRRPAERNASTPATCVKETLSCGQDILAYLDGVQFEGRKQKATGDAVGIAQRVRDAQWAEILIEGAGSKSEFSGWSRGTKFGGKTGQFNLGGGFPLLSRRRVNSQNKTRQIISAISNIYFSLFFLKIRSNSFVSRLLYYRGRILSP